MIETWDKDSIIARIFGKHWHEFSPPSTLNYFSRKTLNEIVSQYDFSLVGQGTPKKRIYSSHAKSFIKHRIAEVKELRWMERVISLIPENIILPYPSKICSGSCSRKSNPLLYFICQGKFQNFEQCYKMS